MSWKKRIVGVVLGLFLVLLILVAHRLFKKGSNAPLVLIPAPVLYTDTDIDPFGRFSSEDQNTTVPVFFASNRVGRGPLNNRVYTNDWNEKVVLGRAGVRFGDKATTWEQLHAASISSDRSVPMPVRLHQSEEFGALARTVEMAPASNLTIGDEAWALAMNETLSRKRVKEIKIYIHGYKVDFAHGCQMGAQLHHFAARDGVTVAFNWACRQRDITYFGDQKRARQSIPDLVDLVEFLAEHTIAERINLLAYSAGSPILSSALVELRKRHADLDPNGLFAKLKVDDVIFAASDLDIQEFVHDLKAYYDLPQRILVTVCYDDAALSLSRKVHGRSRLGSADVNDLLANEVEILSARLDKIDVVDVTYTKDVQGTEIGWIGHGYWYRNPWICTDLLLALYLNLDPEQRGITQIPGRQHSWYFSQDYPDRVLKASQRFRRADNEGQ